MATVMSPLSLGEFLLEEFMHPLELSAYRLAKDINVPVSRIQDILNNRRRISPDTALRLSRYFSASEEYFLTLQLKLDLEETKRKLRNELEAISPYKMRCG